MIIIPVRPAIPIVDPGYLATHHVRADTGGEFPATHANYHQLCAMIEHLDGHRRALRDLPEFLHSELHYPGGSGMLEHSHIEIGFQVYVDEGGEGFGAVRGYVPNANALVIYIENAGHFVVGRVSEVNFRGSHDQPKLVPIDKQSDDEVMHLNRFRKTDCLTGQSLDPDSQP
jgi:hypothetical protein